MSSSHWTTDDDHAEGNVTLRRGVTVIRHVDASATPSTLAEGAVREEGGRREVHLPPSYVDLYPTTAG
jgi:2-keto-3-deoxy-galactonokinase